MPSNREVVLSIDEVSYGITKGHRQQRTLLNKISMKVHRGESVAVMGPSGAGKSTLLSLCLGLDRPSHGVITVDGHDITSLRGSRLVNVRAKSIGVVFQHGELLPELSPAENVALPALLHRQGGRDAFGRAAVLLERLGLTVGDTPTASLSGGERQRVAVARALIARPALIVADEPTGSLDSSNRDLVASLLFGLPHRDGCGLLVVTHDDTIAARADRVFDLRETRLWERVCAH